MHPNEDTYTGNWVNGQKHGLFQIRSSSNSQSDRYFVNGEEFEEFDYYLKQSKSREWN